MFVVDGYNAIRRVERLRRVEARGGLEAGRKALLTAIVSSGVLGSHRVVVVFDGSSEVQPSERSPHRSLTVRYSRAPENADRAIVSFVGRRGRDVETVVVSADEELSFAVKGLGATVVAPERWSVLQLPRRRKRSAESRSSEKPTATSADVAYWLEIFEDED